MAGDSACNARKHAGPKRRIWRKIPLGIDEAMLEIQAAAVTSSDTGDALVLPELLAQVLPIRPLSNAGLPLSSSHGKDAKPCRTAKPWKADTAGAVARNKALAGVKHSSRAISRRWRGHHHRGRVDIEAGSENNSGDRFSGDWMHCVKLLRQRLMARDFDRQVVEFQVRHAVLNGCAALGVPVTRVAG